ncbi:DDE-type integrase/transposase/recombinase [Falsiroseomonas sp. E2-1-a20]|uniref:DDE-type integrase/transposase/recombinase n=1 Tax=Falsiroseomonas sp. E2-1-a20 TaxID=3239300 RepID=UPI003F2C66EA
MLAEIRAITDARPTYGYRRVTALLNRSRRSSGEPLINHKRIFRLMRLSSLLLQPHTGRRPIRAHEGTVVAPASNQRWASDGLEIPCWNGEVVRVAFAIDTHDREIIAWVATAGGGISGEMIRDMMLDCVERRFDAIRAPQPVQWLADNGSAYTAAETTDFAAALNLVPCFTPVRSPESTDEFEQPLSTFRANFLLRMGDRVAKSGAWRRKPRRAAYVRSSCAASMRTRRGPAGCHPLVRRSYAASPSPA